MWENIGLTILIHLIVRTGINSLLKLNKWQEICLGAIIGAIIEMLMEIELLKNLFLSFTIVILIIRIISKSFLEKSKWQES